MNNVICIIIGVALGGLLGAILGALSSDSFWRNYIKRHFPDMKIEEGDDGIEKSGYFKAIEKEKKEYESRNSEQQWY